MTVDAIAAVRALAPDATIDLVVGEWNEADREAHSGNRPRRDA